MDRRQKQFMAHLGHVYLQNGKTDRARIVFRALAVLFPEDPYVHKACSYIYLREGNDTAALEEANRYLVTACHDTGRSVGYLLGSKALWRMGRTAEARDMFERYQATRSNP